MRYAEVAKRVLRPLIDGEIPDAELDAMIELAYSGFRHPAICPLSQLDDNLFLLELFHGPTLAFKGRGDAAARAADGPRAAREERARHHRRRDLGRHRLGGGGGLQGLDQVDVFILFPHGRVSEVQRKQMTSVNAPNVHALAIDGNFDDCQNLVKAMFQHADFADAVKLSGVNSINWAASPRRPSTISRPRWRWAPRIARCPSRCRRAISATSSPAGSRRRWGCRSSG